MGTYGRRHRGKAGQAGDHPESSGGREQGGRARADSCFRLSTLSTQHTALLLSVAPDSGLAGGLVVKNLSCSARDTGDAGLTSRLGRSLE